ncbi:MAG: hypothetical protein JRD89_01645 [Deltaproteobacteria bacterium]|nr:hypothetical protein [Deltaproteobacteria bacterium]
MGIVLTAGAFFPLDKGVIPLCWPHDFEAQHLALGLQETAPAALELPPPEVIPTEEIPSPEAMALEKAEFAKEELVGIKSLEIDSQEDLDFANEILAEVKKKFKEIDAEEKGVTQPINASLKKIRDWFRPAKTAYTEAEKILKSKILAGIEAIQARQDAALLALQEAHKEQNVAATASALAVVQESAIEQPSNVSVIKKWAYRVVDFALVPREYCAPSPELLKAAVKASDGTIKIPGVEIFEESTLSQRKL